MDPFSKAANALLRRYRSPHGNASHQLGQASSDIPSICLGVAGDAGGGQQQSQLRFHGGEIKTEFCLELLDTDLLRF